MKITIEGTATELKEFYENKLFLNNPTCEVEKIEKDKSDGITAEGDWIVFRYKGKERNLYKENEKKSDGDEYFTFNEAVEHCKNLNNRHLPSIEERQELLKARCEWRCFKTDGCGVYSSGNQGIFVGRRFAEDFNLPFAGNRDRGDAKVNNQTSRGYYWTSSPSNAIARLLLFSSSSANFIDSGRANGFSVRCFKNSYGPQTLTSGNQTDD